jgi:benzoate 4-monooxygenase
MSRLLQLLWHSIDLSTIAVAIPAAFVLIHVVPYFYDPHGIRLYPGPFIAKFSDIWLGLVAKNGHRSEVVHEMHKKYGILHSLILTALTTQLLTSFHVGPLVRLAPNHISVADPDALAIIYAHGNGALKSGFYDAFVSIRRGVFNTRDRNEHTRKRKIISHIFSQKSVIEFEPHIHSYVATFIRQWDRLCDAALKGMSGHEGEGWTGQDGRLWLDCLPCTQNKLSSYLMDKPIYRGKLSRVRHRW